MAAKKVIQAGHPSLKAKNKVIEDFTSTQLKKLIKDLKETLYKTELVGIAAPQIAQNYTVFVTHSRNTKARKRKLGKTDICRVYINPHITYFSKKEGTIYEGCGSVVTGGLFGPVVRPIEVTVEAYEENGEKFSLTSDGLLARIIQHEYDHLMGIEFIQKVSDYNKVLDEVYYRKTVRNSKEQLAASQITKIVYKKLTS